MDEISGCMSMAFVGVTIIAALVLLAVFGGWWVLASAVGIGALAAMAVYLLAAVFGFLQGRF